MRRRKKMINLTCRRRKKMINLKCTNGHSMQQGWKKCPECGADPKQFEAKDLIPLIEEM